MAKTSKKVVRTHVRSVGKNAPGKSVKSAKSAKSTNGKNGKSAKRSNGSTGSNENRNGEARSANDQATFDLINRKNGATIADIRNATGWKGTIKRGPERVAELWGKTLETDNARGEDRLHWFRQNGRPARASAPAKSTNGNGNGKNGTNGNGKNGNGKKTPAKKTPKVAPVAAKRTTRGAAKRSR